MTTWPRTLWQPQQLLAICTTLLLHALLIGYLLQQEFDSPPPEPVLRSIQMRIVSIPPVQERVAIKPQQDNPQQPKPPQVEPIKKQQLSDKVIPEQKPATKLAEAKALPAKADKPVLADTSPAISSKSAPAHSPVAESSSATNIAIDSVAAKKQTDTDIKPGKVTTDKLAEAQPTMQATPVVSEPAFDVKNYQPVFKQAPDYPARAMDQGLQGDCTVSYTVNAQGRVENPRAESDCHPLFVRPALNAAKSFQYQPRVVNGQAVTVQQVRNVFQFRISGH